MKHDSDRGARAEHGGGQPCLARAAQCDKAGIPRSGGPQRAAGPVRVAEAEDTGGDAGAAEDGADTDEPRTPWDELQPAAAPTRTATLAAASTRHDGGRAALRFERRTPPSQPAYCGTGHHRTQSPTALGRRHN